MSNVFTRSILKACIFAAAFLAIITVGDVKSSLSSRSEVRVDVVNSVQLDYRGDLNRWVVNGRVIPLDCPEEDSCQVQRSGSFTWIYKIAP